MKYKKLIIEKKEYVLLKQLIQVSGYYGDQAFRTSVAHLKKELEVAHVCDEEQVPEDVIRFNSRVCVKSGDGWKKRFQLVLPSQSDIKNDKVSILTPMGAALIGYAAGDTLVWEFPGGSRELTIEEVVQSRETV